MPVGTLLFNAIPPAEVPKLVDAPPSAPPVNAPVVLGDPNVPILLLPKAVL